MASEATPSKARSEAFISALVKILAPFAREFMTPFDSRYGEAMVALDDSNILTQFPDRADVLTHPLLGTMLIHAILFKDATYQVREDGTISVDSH